MGCRGWSFSVHGVDFLLDYFRARGIICAWGGD